MSKLIERLKLNSLKASKKTQVRLELNPEALETYTQIALDAKGKGAEPDFPPLVVFRNGDGDHLSDGFTRRVALKEAGFDEFDCEVKEGGPMDAFLYGARVNQQHGARLTNKDKKNILEIALDDKELVKLSNNALAKELGLTESYVQRNRPKSKTPGEVEVKAKGGGTKKIKTANIGKKGGKTKKAKVKTGKAAEKEKESVSKMVNKIATAVGGKEGEKIRTALNTGTINLPVKELKKWTETSEKRIAQIANLVTDLQLTPTQAIKEIDKSYDAKTKLETLIIAALANNGVIHEKIEKEDHKVVVYDPKKVEVDIKPK